MSRRKAPAHPELIPLWCRWFGHAMHNAAVSARGGRGVYLGEDRCLRRGCPGDGHVWSRFEPVGARTTTHRRRCTVTGCPATQTMTPPPMLPGLF